MTFETIAKWYLIGRVFLGILTFSLLALFFLGLSYAH